MNWKLISVYERTRELDGCNFLTIGYMTFSCETKVVGNETSFKTSTYFIYLSHIFLAKIDFEIKNFKRLFSEFEIEFLDPFDLSTIYYN